jgi:hypothetical protein
MILAESDLINVGAPSGEFDYGVLQDASTPGSGDGTPVEKTMYSDLYYAICSVIKQAGDTPDSARETADTSQFRDAVLSLIQGNATFTDAAATRTGLGVPGLSADNTFTGNNIFTGKPFFQTAGSGNALILNNTLAPSGEKNYRLYGSTSNFLEIALGADDLSSFDSLFRVGKDGRKNIINDAGDGLETIVTRENELGGSGQSWQDVTASRTPGTPFTNTTGKPILAVFSFHTSDTTARGITVDGVLISRANITGGSIEHTITAIIPNDSIYTYSAGGSGNKMYELR